MQQMPQQTAMQQAMPVGAPAQSNKGGLGALAAQRQQGGQADPRLMAMMQAMGGNRPQPAMPMSQQAAAQAAQMRAMQTAQQIPLGGPGFSQGMQMGQPPSGFDAFMQQRQQQDAMNAQRAMQNGTMPQFEDQMRQRDMAMQGITQVDIDRMRNLQMSGDPSFQAESDAFNARANANRMAALQGQFGAQGGMPGAGMGTFGPNDMPVQYDPRKPGGMMPGGVPVQRPLPVGAGGKGTGMPPPGMIDQLRPGVPVQRPIPLPPGVNRPMPMPMPPRVAVDLPRTFGPKPVPVRPTPKPVNPRFNQIMPFLR